MLGSLFLRHSVYIAYIIILFIQLQAWCNEDVKRRHYRRLSVQQSMY